MFDISKMIEIDKKYQKSVNLKLDYNQMEKINSYIPTGIHCGIKRLFTTD